MFHFITDSLKPALLFEAHPQGVFTYGTVLFIAYGILIALGILLFLAFRLRLVASPIKRTLRGMPSHLFQFGIVGLILIGFRLSDISYLSMRMWHHLLLVVFLIWIYFTVRHFQREYPKKKALYSKDLEEKRQKMIERQRKISNRDKKKS